MFTAIVLTDQSALLLDMIAHDEDLAPAGWAKFCHHCTLNLGPAKDKNTLGSARRLTVTHIGKSDKAVAFRVDGADDSANLVPHVTAFVAPGAKPKDANGIFAWRAIEQFSIFGEIRECQ